MFPALMLYIGGDNGISGALAAINKNSRIISILPMPVQKARKGNEINILAVWQWMEPLLHGEQNFSITIEEPGGSKSAQAAASMSGSFHTLRALCALKGLRWHRITPQSWQRVMLPNCTKGDTKPRALAAARALWPDHSFLATERSKVPHDGIVDAVLIAEFARKTSL